MEKLKLLDGEYADSVKLKQKQKECWLFNLIVIFQEYYHSKKHRRFYIKVRDDYSSVCRVCMRCYGLY